MVLRFSLAHSSDEVTVLLRKGVSFLLLLWSIKYIYGFKYLQKKLKKKKQEEKLGTKTRTQQRNAAVCTSVTLNAPDVCHDAVLPTVQTLVLGA